MTYQEAIDYIMSHCLDCEHMQEGECVADNQCFEANRMAINALRETTGEWICRNGKHWDGLYYCSKCGKSSHTKDNYCSRCGAFNNNKIKKN